MITMGPWEWVLPRCKEIVTGPGNYHVVIDAHDKTNNHHAKTNTWKKSQIRMITNKQTETTTIT